MNVVLTKYFTGELTSVEINDLFNQLESDEALKAEFIRLQNIYALTHLSDSSKNDNQGQESFKHFIQLVNKKKYRKIIRRVMQYAAISLLLITSTLFTTRYFYDKSLDGGQMNTLFVPPGQRAHLQLQDGTSVWLNAHSTLTYPARFTGNKRQVAITGEAFFDVAKDVKKPFIVSTQHLEMKVLGTRFNVRSYPEAGYIQADLIEGSLLVYEKTYRNSVKLNPNEQVYIKDGKMKVGKIEFSDYFLWKDGIYVFENERLSDIIEKLQLYYDVKIIVKNPELFDVRYTGKFRQRDGIDEILRIMQKIRKFTIEKNIETNTIIINK